MNIRVQYPSPHARFDDIEPGYLSNH